MEPENLLYKSAENKYQIKIILNDNGIPRLILL